MTDTRKKARRAAPLICAAAMAVAAAGCPESPAQPAPAEPGSKAAASPPPKDLPKGVKVGPGKAEVQ